MSTFLDIASDGRRKWKGNSAERAEMRSLFLGMHLTGV